LAAALRAAWIETTSLIAPVIGSLPAALRS
jgi:hypothetical protein